MLSRNSRRSCTKLKSASMTLKLSLWDLVGWTLVFAGLGLWMLGL